MRGPDKLWGGDIKNFHPPSGVFEGVIGGPPCQEFSELRHVHKNKKMKWGNLIPEFERVISEAQPEWFVMENIKMAPLPVVAGYHVQGTLLNNRWLGFPQNRVHRLSFGTKNGTHLTYDIAIFESPEWAPRVLACGYPTKITHVKDSHNLHLKVGPTNRTVRDGLRLQGLPENFLDDAPFTVRAKQSVIGNAVAFPMAKALAKAVKKAMEIPLNAPLL